MVCTSSRFNNIRLVFSQTILSFLAFTLVLPSNSYAQMSSTPPTTIQSTAQSTPQTTAPLSTAPASPVAAPVAPAAPADATPSSTSTAATEPTPVEKPIVKKPRKKKVVPVEPTPPMTPTGEVTTAASFMTLKQAVDMALEQNPSIRQAREKIRELESQVPVTRAKLFPTVTYSTTVGHDKDAVTSNIAKFDGEPYNQYQTDLKLTQPLFYVGAFDGIDASRNDRDSSAVAVEILERDTLSTLIQNYFNVVLAARSLRILEDEFKVVKEVFDTSAHRARIGRNQILDALSAKTQTATIDAQIQAAKSAYEVAIATLANTIGDQKLMNFRMKDTLNVPSMAVVDKFVNSNHTRLPELEQNKLAIEKVGQQKRVFLGTNLPSLNLTGDLMYTAYKKSDVFDSASESYNVGLALTIPIFSGLSSLYQMRSYVSQQTELELARRNIQNNIDLQHVSSRKTLESAEQSIILGEEAYKLGRASSEEAKRGYRYATIDFLQFLQVETTYLTAQNSLNTYKYNYMVALAKYYAASGQNMLELVGLLEELNK